MREIEGGITASRGFFATGVSCGIKKAGLLDLALVVSETEAAIAGVFTRNRVKAAPVLLCRERVLRGKFSALVANSGNANACTGRRGMNDARKMARIASQLLGRPEEQVFVASTGVIGEPLPMEKVAQGISLAVSGLGGVGQSERAARAIMTTDTFPKEAGVSFTVEGTKVNIGGMAKGSGMIYPRMGTMLAFLSSDANISPALLARTLKRAVARSFNRISVDGDTSTNDMVLAFANGFSGAPRIRPASRDYQVFQEGMDQVASALAKMIVRDGEGATKFIRIQVKGGRSEKEAEVAAFAVANSNLVKTAFFGQDCNWGRILSAIGSSGVQIIPEQIDLFLGPTQIVKKGVGLGRDRDQGVKEILKKREIDLLIHLHQGRSQAEVWTTDLTYDYVKINASYRS